MYLSFYLNSTSIHLCSVRNLRTTFPNTFSHWKALAGVWATGERRGHAHVSFGSECAPTTIREKRSSGSGCAAPAWTVVEGGCHPGSKGLLGSAAALGALTVSKPLLFLEATSVSAFKLPGYLRNKKSVGSWSFGRLRGCVVRQPTQLQDHLQLQRQSNEAIRATQFCSFSLEAVGIYLNPSP